MENRKTKEIRENYLKRLAQRALQAVQFVDSMANDEIRNTQWYINWQDHLNEVSVK